MRSKKTTFLCESHPAFSIPEDVDVGEGFDGEAYEERMRGCVGCYDLIVMQGHGTPGNRQVET